METALEHHRHRQTPLSRLRHWVNIFARTPVWRKGVPLLLVSAVSGQAMMAETYHVRNDGNDTADGLTDATAWSTLAKVNAVSYEPGDKVLFRSGDTWREALVVSSSGASGNYIEYGSYGTGPKPEILGSTGIMAWTQVASNIWSGNTVVPRNPITSGYSGAQIFFKEADGSVSWGHHESYTATYSNLTEEYDWTWNDSTVFIYSPTDPNARYAGVEAPQIEHLVRLNGTNYVGIDNLALKFIITAGIYDDYGGGPNTDLRVTNCDIGYIGIKGGGAAYGIETYHSNSYYGHNSIHDCGRRSISQNLYTTTPAITCENVLIEHNRFYNGFHTTGIDIANSGTHTLRNYTIRKNFFEGDPDEDLQGEDGYNSNHVFIQQAGSGGYVGGINLNNNIFTYAHASGIKIQRVGDIEIYHNTFYKFNETIGNYQAFIYNTEPPEPILIKNNIFYHNPDHRRLADIRMSTGYEGQFEINHNLYYHEHPNTRLYWCDSGSFDASDAAAYQTATGFDLNSLFLKNPKFKDGPGKDFSIDADSPAIGAGIPVPDVSSDYLDHPINNPPDLGAVQSIRELADWAGYPVFDNWYVDTGNWLGLLFLMHDPYVYSFDLKSYLFIMEKFVSAGGAWVYVQHS